jgi:hypothetical protein
MKKRLFPTALALAVLTAPLLALLPSGARAGCGPYKPVTETPTTEKPCEKKAGSDCPCPDDPASPEDCWGYRDGCKPTGCGTAGCSSPCCPKDKPCGGCESCEQACPASGCCSRCVKPDGAAALHKEIADLKQTCAELLSRIDVLTREVQASREQVLQRLANMPLVQFSYPSQPPIAPYNIYQQLPYNPSVPVPNVVPNTTSSSPSVPQLSAQPSVPAPQ